MSLDITPADFPRTCDAKGVRILALVVGNVRNTYFPS